jgi:hypothetical protein
MSCKVHPRHAPPCITTHDHHIVPQAMLGESVPENMVEVCPTGHYNIHAALASLVFGKAMPKVTKEEQRLAQLGYDRWTAAGSHGNPHASYG